MSKFLPVPLDRINRIQPDDYIRWNGLEGTVVEFFQHDNGFTYSLWIQNPDHNWMNDFEWLMTGDSTPGIRKGHLEWSRIFSV